jgi:hypothetical protein
MDRSDDIVAAAIAGDEPHSPGVTGRRPRQHPLHRVEWGAQRRPSVGVLNDRLNAG